MVSLLTCSLFNPSQIIRNLPSSSPPDLLVWVNAKGSHLWVAQFQGGAGQGSCQHRAFLVHRHQPAADGCCGAESIAVVRLKKGN